MEPSISAQLAQIINQLKSLESLKDPLWLQPEFVGAALASIVALGIALYGEPLRRRWIKTTLLANKVVHHVQGRGDLIVYRLLIINVGNHKAQDVEVTVDKLYEDGGVERKNFLPVPLGWTHAHAYVRTAVLRDIHPGQWVYLDLCDFIHSQREGQGFSEAVLRLSAQAGQEIPDFNRLKPGKTKLLLKAYQTDGKPLPIEIIVEWDGNNEPKIGLGKS